MRTDQTIDSLSQEELARLYREHVLTPWVKQNTAGPLMITDAKGVFLTLANGTRLLDMKSQAFTANLGHAHEGMQAAMVAAAKNGRVLASEAFCSERLELAMTLKRIA